MTQIQKPQKPGVNFTNVLLKAFTIPKAQKTDGLTVFFVLLGFENVKAAHKTLMKLTPANKSFFLFNEKLFGIAQTLIGLKLSNRNFLRGEN